MKGFTVIDKTTGQYPDCEKIALEEDWAKHLLYCDIDEFAINEDGDLLLMDDCGKVAYCPNDRFDVVEEVEALPLEGKDNWHTGTPTEDGLYIIIIHPYGSCANEPRYFCYTIEDGILKDCIDDGNIDADDFWSQYAIAWQKIEPYRG